MTALRIPDLSSVGLDKQTEMDLAAILYGLELIRASTGFGQLVIEIKDGQVVELESKHKIRPKYMKGAV